MPELTTVETVRTWIGASEEDDAIISICLEAAERKIRVLCQNRSSFLSAEYTDEFDGLDWDALILKHTPIDLTGATTVVLRVSTDTDDDVTVASTSYRIEESTGILRLIQSPESFLSPSLILAGSGSAGFGFPPGFRNVAVTYTGGYAADSIPADLALIAIEWASSLFAAKDTDPTIASERLGDHAVTYTATTTRTGADAEFRARLIEGGFMTPVI